MGGQCPPRAADVVRRTTWWSSATRTSIGSFVSTSPTTTKTAATCRSERTRPGAVLSSETDENYPYTGSRLAPAGDVNGDGFDDLHIHGQVEYIVFGGER